MMNVHGPDFITLLVRDLEASRRFYAETLGLPQSAELRPNAYAFSTRPIAFAIRKAPDGFDPGAQPGNGVLLWFKANDAAAFHAELVERGVPVVEGLTEGPFGKTFTFADPDGYRITVHDGG